MSVNSLAAGTIRPIRLPRDEERVRELLFTLLAMDGFKTVTSEEETRTLEGAGPSMRAFLSEAGRWLRYCGHA